MAPDKVKQLFRLFLLEGPVAFSPMFGSSVFPCREFVHIHRCQNRNNTGVLTVFGRGLHRNHAVGGPSRIELFVIPHFMIPMQIEVTVLVWSALLFHYQIKREDTVCVFERADAGNVGVLDTTVFIQYLQGSLRMHVGNHKVAFQSFFTVDDDSLYFFVFNNDAGGFAVVKYCPSIRSDHVNQFQADLHTAVHKTISSFDVGMVNHGMLVEGGDIFQASVEQGRACQYIL